jgi:hypothetical protein
MLLFPAATAVFIYDVRPRILSVEQHLDDKQWGTVALKSRMSQGRKATTNPIVGKQK